MLFFALAGSDELGGRVADAGGFPLARHEEREFEGGEHKSRPLVSVRGRDVYVLHGLQGRSGASANDKLCRLLFFIAACKENGAARVTAIVPYLAYSRKDRQTKPRDPVTTKYVAALFEAAGADTVVTVDVHTIMAFQNAFRCTTVHLDTRKLFAEHLAGQLAEGDLAVVSPDGGGVKRAQLFQEVLQDVAARPVEFGFMEKRRSAGVVSGSLFAGEVSGRTVYIVDDMICGGGTMLRAARACRDHGATAVHAVATHALFGDAITSILTEGALDSVVVSDSAIPFQCPEGDLADRLSVVSIAPLLADAITRLHDGRSIDELLGV
jgi:ribose-phosphate pyrophosphokinase